MSTITAQKLSELFPGFFWVKNEGATIEEGFLLDDAMEIEENKNILLSLEFCGYEGKDCDNLQIWIIEFKSSDNDMVRAFFYNEDFFDESVKKLKANLKDK